MEESLIEIRVHGRGGQGAKTAAQLIVETALEEGSQVQAFPEYGPERTGAPVKTYVRLSDKPIRSYAPITKPDIVIVIDPTLLKTVDVTKGLTKEGLVIINTNKKTEEIRKEFKNYKGKIAVLDATKISLTHLNKNIPNMAMLGAFIKVTHIIGIKNLKNKIKSHFLKKLGPEKTNLNLKMVDEAYELA